MIIAIRALASAAVFLAFLLSTSGKGEDPERPTLVLHLTNHSRTPTRALRRAEQEVSMAYWAAGVDTIWIDRMPKLEEPLPAKAIDVVIMSPEMDKQQRIDYRLRPDDLGYAVPPARRVYVFWVRIRETEVQFSRDSGEVLGLVIAHEVGHVLLPYEGHAPRGIMEAALDLRLQSRQGFSREEAKLIRVSLNALDVPARD